LEDRQTADFLIGGFLFSEGGGEAALNSFWQEKYP
jgi:hypothetical protein